MFCAEYLFNDPSFVDALTSESDESNAPSENVQPLSSSNSRTTSESTSVSGLSICQLSAEDAKIINEFSLEKHTKVQILLTSLLVIEIKVLLFCYHNIII